MRIKAKERYRTTDGTIVPSVTTALGILNKPALVRWANRLGLDGIDVSKYTSELADIGTLTHYLIMCRLREEDPDVSDFTPEQLKAAQKCLRKFVDWESINPVTPVLIETPIISEQYQYGGTPDLYAICNKDLLLADFKTSTSGIFPEMIYQVSAYRQLLRELGYRVSRAVILRIGRDESESTEERTLTEREMDTGFKIFIRALEIYKLSTGKQID